MTQHSSSDVATIAADTTTAPRAPRALPAAQGRTVLAEHSSPGTTAGLRGRVGAWLARHLVEAEPYPQLSRLDRRDGARTEAGGRTFRADTGHDSF